MHWRYLALSLLALSLTGCKHDGLVGTYNGTEHMSPAEEQAFSQVPGTDLSQEKAKFAQMRGTLILNGDGSATETNNYKGGHQFSGTWAREGDKVKLTLSGGEDQTLDVSADGKTLTTSNWTYTKQ